MEYGVMVANILLFLPARASIRPCVSPVSASLSVPLRLLLDLYQLTNNPNSEIPKSRTQIPLVTRYDAGTKTLKHQEIPKSQCSG